MTNPLPLRAVYPHLYDVFIAKLEEEHLHAYDAKAVLTRTDEQVTLTVFAGDNYEQRVEGTFQSSQIDKLDDSVIEFITSAVGRCKEIVKDDYRIFMKVQP
jgi:hypothetical protein